MMGTENYVQDTDLILIDCT